MAKKADVALLLIEKNSIVLYAHAHPNGVSFAFPDHVIEGMEIQNYEQFHSFIASLCQSSKTTVGDVLVIYGSSLLFEKQLPLLPEDQLVKEVENFRVSTPFERVAARYYKNPQGIYLVSINRDFFDTLRQSIERNGARVSAILPAPICSTLLGKKPLSFQAVQTLASRSDEVGELSILIGKTAPKTLQQQEEYLSKQYSGVLIAGFIIFLLGVFALTGYILRSQFQAARQPAATPPPAVVSPSPVPITSPSFAPSPLTPAAVRIMIVAQREGASRSDTLRSLFVASGYQAPAQKTADGIGASQTVVVIRPQVSGQMRTQILSLLEEAGEKATVQENADVETDVWITLSTAEK